MYLYSICRYCIYRVIFSFFGPEGHRANRFTNGRPKKEFDASVG